MSWLQGAWGWLNGLWPWFAGGGVVVAIIAFAVLNPVAALRLGSAVVGFMLDAARNLVVWLRKPGNKLKAMCAVLAMVAAIACLTSYQKNQSFLVVTQQLDTVRAEAGLAKTRIGELEATLATYREQERLYAEAQRKRTAALLLAQQQNEAALSVIEKQRAESERSNRAWWQAYAKRPDACKAAQEALDVACATVGEF